MACKKAQSYFLGANIDEIQKKVEEAQKQWAEDKKAFEEKITKLKEQIREKDEILLEKNEMLALLQPQVEQLTEENTRLKQRLKIVPAKEKEEALTSKNSYTS